MRDEKLLEVIQTPPGAALAIVTGGRRCVCREFLEQLPVNYSG